MRLITKNVPILFNILWYYTIKYSPLILITAIGICSALVIIFDYIKLPNLNLMLAVLIIIFVVLYLLRIQLIKEFYYMPLNGPKQMKDWIPFGKCTYKKDIKCYCVEGRPNSTNFDSILFYNNCIVWSNYEVFFDFRVDNVCFGILIRALNRSNFIMLQINLDSIKPHIRINDTWAKFDVYETNLQFNKPILQKKWYKGQISCIGNKINIKVTNNSSILIDKVWSIPEGSLIVNNTNIINLPINFYYGSVGFKASRVDDRIS